MFRLILTLFILYSYVAISQPANYYMNPDFGADGLFTLNTPVTGIVKREIQATSNNTNFYIEWDGQFNEWYNTSINLNEEFTLTFQGASGLNNTSVLNSATTTNKYYTIQINGLDYSNRQAVIMETDNQPVAFAASNPVTPSVPNVFPGQDLDISVSLAGNKSAQEKAFVRYSDNGYSTSQVAEVSFSSSTANSGSAIIPGSFNTAGKSVSFYVYTTTVSANNSSFHDLITLNLANNGGSNFSYTVNNSWTTSNGSGNFADAAAWDAGEVPPAGQPIVIEDNITLNTNYTAGSLTISPGVTFTNSDGANSYNLTLQNGATLTNNGTFEGSDGKITFNGTGTISGSFTFNDVAISGGVDFGASSTVNGELTINSGGFVNTNAPQYGPASTLNYNTGGDYGQGTEWPNTNSPNSVTFGSNVRLQSARTFNGTLAFSGSGSLELQNAGLTLGAGANITGFGPSNYIITSSTHSLTRQGISSTPVIFPVGNASYNPVTITNAGTTDDFSVRVINNVNEEGTSGTAQTNNAVNRTWIVEESVVGGSDVTLQVQWNATDELTGFNRSSSFLSHYESGSWNPGVTQAASGSNPYAISQTGITSFSPFGVGSGTSVLPVTWLNFNAKIENHKVAIRWATLTETSSKVFEIEEKKANGDWEKIGEVNAAGFSNVTRQYEFFAKVPTSKSYYRLKQIDFDGAFEYSKSVVVYPDVSSSSVALYPNPINDIFYINGLTSNNYKLFIYDLKGVLQKQYISENTFKEFNISDLTSGIYLVEIRNDYSFSRHPIIKK